MAEENSFSNTLFWQLVYDAHVCTISWRYFSFPCCHSLLYDSNGKRHCVHHIRSNAKDHVFCLNVMSKRWVAGLQKSTRTEQKKKKRRNLHLNNISLSHTDNVSNFMFVKRICGPTDKSCLCCKRRRA